jgi:hypothetical protein
MLTFIPRTLLGLVVVGITTISAAAQQMPWVVASLEEINLASPVVGAATVPLSLARTALAAVPQVYLNDARDSGFDLALIEERVVKMPYDQELEMVENGYHLVIRKILIPVPGEVESNRLIVQNDTINLPPIPLSESLISTAIYIATLQLEELKGKEPELQQVIRELRRTPPGVILTGVDYLTEGWLRIYLE